MWLLRVELEIVYRVARTEKPVAEMKTDLFEYPLPLSGIEQNLILIPNEGAKLKQMFLREVAVLFLHEPIYVTGHIPRRVIRSQFPQF